MNQQALTPSERARVGLWIRLARCYNLAFRELRSGLREECTMPQFDVLAQLERSPEGLTFSAISEKLLVTAGNLTGIVDRLEKQGLARRETNPNDRRQTFIKLTDKGREYCDKVIPQHTHDIARLLGGLSDNTVQNLRTDLDRLAALLDGKNQ
ncbi:MAG: MarR family transcriptional regulator [Planctomycetes bacterium]|nr:MarR family transcriptional regulator [Planctomycetota bacterium]MCA8947205.1 MarR family transcriptional regulator [Planctomycetota bacterium]